jgi:hypothetical protein
LAGQEQIVWGLILSIVFYEEIKSIIVKTQCVLLCLKRRIKLLVAKATGDRERVDARQTLWNWGVCC